MNKTKILLVAVMSVFALSGWSVYAHGTDTGMGGSTGMMNMMELMHEQMDSNQALNCNTVSDMDMMEHGEDMMEEIMGHEDHEKMEESMNAEDHDAMHMMMGMWSSGCVGEENMGTLAARYGYSHDAAGSGMMGGWGGMGGLGFVTNLLIWVILVMAIMALWKWIKSKPSEPIKPV